MSQSISSSQQAIYKLTYTVPTPSLPATKAAVFAAGGGTCAGGQYRECLLRDARR